MQLTSIQLLALAGALGVTAHPSGHHAHRRAHEQVAERDVVFYKAVHTTTVEVVVTADPEPTEAPATTTSSPPPPPPAPTTSSTSSSSSAAAVHADILSLSVSIGIEASSTSSSAVATSSSSSSSSSGTYKDFSCTSSSKRATAAEIAYTGNVGTPYGCNMMEIDSDIIDLYSFTVDLQNSASEEYSVICSNKIGSDGGINGFWEGNEVLSFTVDAGASQAVAFQNNTQGLCSFCPGSSMLTTSIGEYACAWVEFDFANESNQGASGSDCSALVALTEGLTIPGCHVSAPTSYTDASWFTASAATGNNSYWQSSTTDADGLGLQISSGAAAHVVAVMGYSG